MNYYSLDPANFLTRPSLAWGTMLLHTRVKLNMLSNADILLMVEKTTRGGLCFVGSKRYVKANSKYMPDYNQNEESNYIIYEDAVNLYGFSMSEFSLRYGGLEFVNKFNLDKILRTPDDNYTGYIIEVDLLVPIELHDKLKEDPPAPETLTPELEWLSDYQKEIE